MVIYLFPLVIDLVLFLVVLRVSDAAGRADMMHLSDLKAAALISIQAVTYVPACFAVGRVLSGRNAKPLLVASLLVLMLAAIPLFFTNVFEVALVLLGVMGIGAAVFFNATQTFMRGSVPPGSLARTIAIYNFAWGLGIALGFLFGGILNSLGGGRALAIFSTSICLIVLWLIVTYKTRALEHESTDGIIEHSPHPRARPVDARYVLVGWMLAFIMNFTQRPLAVFTPKFFAEAGRAKSLAGVLMFTLVLAQAAASLAGPKLRRWLYGRSALITLHAGLALALLAAWPMFGMFWWSMLTYTAIGAIMGLMIFASIYYVSNDPQSNRHVGVNEAAVGIGNLTGAMGCAIIAQMSFPTAFFPATIGVTVLSLVAQLVVLRKPLSPPAAAMVQSLAK